MEQEGLKAAESVLATIGELSLSPHDQDSNGENSNSEGKVAVEGLELPLPSRIPEALAPGLIGLRNQSEENDIGTVISLDKDIRMLLSCFKYLYKRYCEQQSTITMLQQSIRGKRPEGELERAKGIDIASERNAAFTLLAQAASAATISMGAASTAQEELEAAQKNLEAAQKDLASLEERLDKAQREKRAAKSEAMKAKIEANRLKKELQNVWILKRELTAENNELRFFAGLLKHGSQKRPRTSPTSSTQMAEGHPTLDALSSSNLNKAPLAPPTVPGPPKDGTQGDPGPSTAPAPLDDGTEGVTGPSTSFYRQPSPRPNSEGDSQDARYEGDTQDAH
ncbi:hypothetical protein AMTRI_Chr10g2350 [Amborella trichopoda]